MLPQVAEVPSLIKEAMKVNVNDFLDLISAVVDLLSKEIDHIGNLKITGKLVRAPPESEAIVIGDIHGDIESLEQILKDSRFIEKFNRGEEPLLIFLGDYGDRGLYSTEVYYVVLKLKEAFPEKVVLMRGNHEGPDDILAYPHDLPAHLYNKFGENWKSAYIKLRELFNHLYNAVLVEDRYVMLHGGVPSQAKTLKDMAYAHRKHPRESHLEEILWSDPGEGLTGTYPSPRGAGKIFGEDVTSEFLRTLSVNLLIRGHEPSDEGFKINHEGKILTLFSRRGAPYYNTRAAYLQIDMSEKVKNAYQLKQFVRFL